MWASIVTFVLLVGLLLWVLAWQRGSRLALGLGIGAALVVIGGPILRAAADFDHMPVWLPALPFAVIALVLFSFGVLAWLWGEE